MRIEDLDSLIWIARLGSFTAAAERLNLTQPGITRRIKELEARLGVSLLSRRGRHVSLTPAGFEALRGAEDIVNRWQEVRAAVGTPDSQAGRVRIGCGELFADLWLKDFLIAADRMFPRLALDLNFDVSERHIAAFEAFELDFLLLPGEPPTSGTARHLGAVDFVWATSQGAPTIGRMGQRDIAAQPLLALSPESNAFRMAMRWFRAGGLSPTDVRFVNNKTLLIDLVIAGAGVALLAEKDILLQPDRLQSLPTEPARFVSPLWAVHSGSSMFPLAGLAGIAFDCHRRHQ